MVDNEPRVKFTQDSRAKALNRQWLVAIMDAFGFRKKYYSKETFAGYSLIDTINSLAHMAKFADLNNVELFNGNERLKLDGMASPRAIRFDDSLKNLHPYVRSQLHALAAHEAVHFLNYHQDKFPRANGFRLWNNDYVVAHALSTYYVQAPDIPVLARGPPYVPMIIERSSFVPLIEQAFDQHAASGVMNEIASTKKGAGNSPHPEYYASKYMHNHSFAEIGYNLGKMARDIEALMEKPGIGIFFIREVAQGKPVITTATAIQKGRFEHERQTWITRHPAIKRAIMLRHFHDDFYRQRQGSNLILKPRKKPIQPSTKMFKERQRLQKPK